MMGPLDAYLPYLLNRAGARLAAAFQAEVRPLGASLQIWRVLAALRERDRRRMGDLALTTAIEVSTLTRLVDTMERRGLVARRRAERGDGRTIIVRTTPEGRRLTARLVPVARRYETVALAGFAPADAEQLKDALRRLYANLDALPANGDAAASTRKEKRP